MLLKCEIYRLRLLGRRFFYYICMGYRKQSVIYGDYLFCRIVKGKGGSPAPDRNSCFGDAGAGMEVYGLYHVGFPLCSEFNQSLTLGMLHI